MSDEINLFRRRRNEQPEKEKQRLKILRIISGTLLAIVVSFSLFLFYMTVNSPLIPLEKEEADILAKFSPLHAKAAKLLITQSRIKDITKIIKDRSSLDKTIQVIIDSMPSNISVSTFLMDKKNVTMILKSESLTSIDAILEQLTQMVKEKRFISKTTINQLSIDTKAAQYSVSLSLDLL